MKVTGTAGIQGHADWHAYRATHIMASDLPIIMGINPWCSPHQLWKKKLGLMDEPALNPNMRRGIENEAIARQIACVELECEFSPAVYQDDDYPWAAASLDGINDTGDVLLEIKCPNERHTCIPEMYKPQIQWQMMCSGAKTCWYCCHVDGYNTYFFENRDDKYISKLCDKAEEFYDMLISLKEPPRFDLPVVEAIDARMLADKIAFEKRALKEFEQHLKEMEKQLLELTGKQDCICGDLKITKCERKGSIEYDKIPELKVVDLEQYRKASSQYWIFKEIASG